MTTPAQRAHLRLLHSDQVRVRTIKRASDGISSKRSGHGGLSRRIEVNGQIFESKNDMRKALHVGTKQIERMLDSGEARYV